MSDIRTRLDAAIARKDAERGRPLTDSERLDNLRRFLGPPIGRLARKAIEQMDGGL